MPRRTPIRWKTYTLMERAVEDGIRYGWRRAHKHTDQPTDEFVVEQMVQGVMDALCEVIQFEAEA